MPSLEDELSNLFDDALVSFKRDNVFYCSSDYINFYYFLVKPTEMR